MPRARRNDVGAIGRRALTLAGLAVLGGGCVVRAPRADHEPAIDDRRGAQARPSEADARELLLEALDRAQAVLAAVPAYEAVLVKEERVHGELLAPQRVECRLRHEPFAVYLRFLSPPVLAGQQALFAGEGYGGKLIARAAGLAGHLGARALDPHGALAMAGNRYPITETGMLRLVQRVREVADDGDRLERLDVLHGADIDGRPCTAFEAYARPGAAAFAFARVYFDNAWGVPVGFEAFEQGPQGLRLLERYTYLSLHLAVELGDDAFDRANPEYALR